ncbi:5-oxoprolinase subunit B family protein [Roseobacter ponti]|uniref:Allophanate hydrolase subunit 1 n=1 Tax=Roseobacter ponti TaxID=1891787 RepID=A0A858SXT4_9RHOB|nr:carboxyltransferase domain-containing protein [Roseobacter ponti]QJF52867.1 allophanate hydrolase subunit 1 [Roseobacter ponti]
MSDYPIIRTVGLSGILVTFAGAMDDHANRVALAFRAAVEAEAWPEVSETSMSLVSVFVVTDLVTYPAEEIIARLQDLLDARDWSDPALPEGRTLWHVPTVYGTDLAPQLEEAAKAVGIDPDEAIRQLSASRVRVLTIGFSPGQPYLGQLDAQWNIPRQQDLTKSVPSGALVLAIRQMCLFTNATPTGWRHVGQTAFRTFSQQSDAPFALSPGDELIFPSVSAAELEKIRAGSTASFGGADREVIA